MLRSKLKNIINKSKGFSNKSVGEPFDEFKESLPKELDYYKGDSYRLKAAWEAYGKPSNIGEALWNGMIQPIDESTYKMPSIGYNEETDEYEYLNKGKENETVTKDIRVWDNDVIPLVKELKLGGYIRQFDEEKDCWTYSKKPIESFLEGGKAEEVDSIPSFLTYNKDLDIYTSKYYSDDDKAEDILWYRSKKSKNFRKKYRLNDLNWEDGSPDGQLFTYIPKEEYDKKLLEKFNSRFKPFGNFGSIVDTNKEIADGQVLTPTGKFAPDGQELYLGLDGETYTLKPIKFKDGGQMSVIPEGALHARKNNMEGAGKDFTAKGIPVVDNLGELLAEIERDEIVFCRKVTDKIEELYDKYNSEDLSLSEKDDIAIEMGKIITCEIMNNTDDKTGLIELVLEKM